MRILSAALAVTATVAATAWVPAVAAAAPLPEDARAVAAVAALDGEPSAAELADIAAMVGYRPVLEAGVATNPDGECSSPVTLPTEFEPLCRAHDLGYDLLRYADRVGAPLGSWARQTLDATLGQRMDTACETRPTTFARNGCHAMAFIASHVVDGNSWRQGYGAPVGESPWPYVFFVVLGGGLLLGALGLRGGAR